MKQLLLICLLLIAGVATAQDYEYKGLKTFPVSAETGRVSYDGVVAVEGKSASELYSSAKEWVARNSDARYAIEMDIPGEKLVGKGGLVQSTNKDHTYTYDFFLAFKDGRYKYEITNLKLHYNYGSNLKGSSELETYPKENVSGNKAKKLDSIYKSIDDDIRRVATQFAMIGEDTKKEDW